MLTCGHRKLSGQEVSLGQVLIYGIQSHIQRIEETVLLKLDLMVHIAT